MVGKKEFRRYFLNITGFSLIEILQCLYSMLSNLNSKAPFSILENIKDFLIENSDLLQTKRPALYSNMLSNISSVLSLLQTTHIVT